MLASEFIPPRTEPNQLPEVLPHLQNFIAHPNTVTVNIPKFCKTAPIDFLDPLLELMPEAYLDTDLVSSTDLERAVDEMARETAAFLVRFGKESAATEFK